MLRALSWMFGKAGLFMFMALIACDNMFFGIVILCSLLCDMCLLVRV